MTRTGAELGWPAMAYALVLFAAAYAAAAVVGAPAFSYADYAGVLKAYVNERSLVDYKGLKVHPEGLDAFVRQLAELKPQVYDTWPEDAKVAFWLNAYNALTLKLIITHYPIQTSFPARLLYPDNSIRQIKGAWTDIKWDVMGRQVTLDYIEHDALMKNFDEPRIHAALVCASMSCPPLRAEPYEGERLAAQLDDQARRFLADPQKGLRIERDTSRIYLSSIFDWFGDYFVKKFGTDSSFAGQSKNERAVLNFVSGYVSAEDRQYLQTQKYTVKFMSYDWSLNEQKPAAN